MIHRAFCVLLLCGYICTVLYLTLFGRPAYHGDPLGIIMGGWDFRLTEEGSDIHAFYNLFMLTPATFLLLNILQDKLIKFSRMMLIAVVFSFGLSLAIELSQVIFCVGTLQISDLIYNTISGVIGAIVYHIVSVKGVKCVKGVCERCQARVKKL